MTMNSKKRMRRIRVLLIATVLAIMLGAVGGTVAWLTDTADKVTNTFTPAKTDIDITEDFDKETKENIKVKNNCDYPAYIRVSVTANYVLNGEIVDSFTLPTELGFRWTKGSDGFYYYTSPVKADESTAAVLFTDAIKGGKRTDGAHLEVNVNAQSIQAIPTQAIKDAGWAWQPN